MNPQKHVCHNPAVGSMGDQARADDYALSPESSATFHKKPR